MCYRDWCKEHLWIFQSNMLIIAEHKKNPGKMSKNYFELLIGNL